MNFYPNGGHVLEVNRKNIESLCQGKSLEELGARLLDYVDERQEFPDICHDPIAAEFVAAISDSYSLECCFVYLTDEVDGTEGVEPNTLYLYFDDDQKYKKEVRSEWAALPIEPHEASWSNLG